MALNGANGYLYAVSLATATTSAGAISSGNWYRISGKSSTGPLPANLTTGYIFYQRSGTDPAASTVAMTSNDAVQLITLTKCAFVTDVNMSGSKEKFDETVQTDSVKSYQVGSKPEMTGTVNGYWIDNDADQQAVVKRINAVVEHTTTGGVTLTAASAATLYFMMSRSESTADGAQVWEYMPMIVDGVTEDKPMEGPNAFSYTFTLKGSERPHTYIYDN